MSTSAETGGRASTAGTHTIPEDPRSCVIHLERVSRQYDVGKVAAVVDQSLVVRRGEFLGVVGPSGSGKSTLLHLMCGMDRPTTGRVFFEGSEPGTPAEWARLRAQRVGFVFQAFHLLPTLTALENVQVPMIGVVAKARHRAERAARLLDQVGLRHRRDHLPGALSAGERQRVAIARALANRPAVVLADEPTGNLDSVTAAEVLALLTELHRSHELTLVIVTHDHGIARGADRIAHMRDGRITAIDERSAG